MTEDAPIRVLRLALDAYVAALEKWIVTVDALNREFKVRGQGTVLADLNNESELYRAAQAIINSAYVGDLPTGDEFDKISQAARRYIMEVDTLANALENLTHHLDEISGGTKPH